MLSSACLIYFQCCALPGRHRENVACLSGTWPSEETKAATFCVRGHQTWFLEAPLCVCLCRCAVPGSRRSTMVVLGGRCLLDQQQTRGRSAWFTASCHRRWHVTWFRASRSFWPHEFTSLNITRDIFEEMQMHIMWHVVSSLSPLTLSTVS